MDTSSPERQPLLAQHAQHDGYRTALADPPPPRKLQSSTSNILRIAAIIASSLLIPLLLLSALLIHSFIPSEHELSLLVNRAITVHPSSDIAVLNFSRSYTSGLIEVSGSVGIDAFQALGIRDADDPGTPQPGERGHGAAWWESLRRGIARHALTTIGPMVADLPYAVTVYPRGSSRALVNVTVFQSIEVPLVIRPPGAEDWLRPFTYQFQVDLLSRRELVGFATKAWSRGAVDVDIVVPEFAVRPQRNSGWRRWIRIKQRDLRISQHIDVPDIPGLPKPTDDLARYITLESYSFHTRRPAGQAGELRVSAVARARNPVGVRVDIPLELGFGIFLPVPGGNSSSGLEAGDGLVKIADVVTMPFKLRGQDTLRIHVEGVVDVIGGDGGALSAFLRNYLEGRANNVTILGLDAFPYQASPNHGERHVPPEWVQHLLPRMHAVVPFPGPDPPPRLIEAVTIEQMKISESGGKMRASGVVVVRVRLPLEMQDIDVQVNGVRPDVLISDGEAGEGPTDPSAPPYPAKAFGRIHPDDYLPAISEPDPTTRGILIVRAPLHDVPIEILQGRDKVLSDFVGKIVFKGSAVAGIAGTAAVRVSVMGIEEPLEVVGLPVRGLVNVGRPRV